jgi:hypothetical protein
MIKITQTPPPTHPPTHPLPYCPSPTRKIKNRKNYMLYNKVETIAENDRSQTYKWRERSTA